MNPKQLEELIWKIIGAEVPAPWWIYIVLILLSGCIGFFIAYLSEYAKVKGKNLATKEDFNQILEQSKKTVEATEQIKLNITEELSEAKERGKNIATKEDIGGITEKIEAVKQAHASALEQIKSTLAVENQQKFKLFEKRTDTMIEFFENASILLSSLKSDFGFRYDDIDRLEKFIEDVNEKIGNLYISFYKLIAYLPPGNIMNAAASIS